MSAQQLAAAGVGSSAPAAGADLGDLDGELFLIDRALRPAPRAVDAAEQRDSVYRRLLGVSDILATTLALVATATFTHASQVYWSMFVSVIFVVPACKLLGLYDRDAQLLHRTTLDEVPRLLTVALIISTLSFMARDLAVIGSSGIGSKQLTFLWLALSVLLCAGRVLARRVGRELTPEERLLVVGGESDTNDLRRSIELSPAIKAKIIGRVPIAFNELPDGRSRVLGETRDLRRVIDATRSTASW